MEEYADLFSAFDQLGREADLLREQNAALVEALRPFAALYQPAMADAPDDQPVLMTDDRLITVGDLRAARAALASVEQAHAALGPRLPGLD